MMVLPHLTFLDNLIIFNAIIICTQGARGINVAFDLLVNGKKNRRGNIGELVGAAATVYLLGLNIGYLWGICGNICLRLSS